MANQFRDISRLPKHRVDVIEKGVSLIGSEEASLLGGSTEVWLKTTKGDLPAVLHSDDRGHHYGIIWLSGSRGGLNGPAGGLYATLSHGLVHSGITSLRLHYRQPRLLPSCVADVMVAIDYLRLRGIDRVALVGHSFGGAVAITAGALSRAVVAVVSLSGQTFGTDLVTDLSPRPLLVAHGTWDQVLTVSCAYSIFGRAREPKRLVIFPGASHTLIECQAELEDLLAGWLIDKVGGDKRVTDWYELSPSSSRLPGHPGKDIRVSIGDITEIRSEGLVCPANEDLTMFDGVAAAISRRGGDGIAIEAASLAPGRPGEAIVTSAGLLTAKHILHAVVSAPQQGLTMSPEETLAAAAGSCFDAADGLGLKSIAFPSLGATGRISLERAAMILLTVAGERLKAASALRTVDFVISGAGAYKAFAAAINAVSRG